LAVGAVGAVAMAILMLLFLSSTKPATKLSGNIILTGTEGLLPATAFFDLNIPAQSDSLFVNFGDKSALYRNPIPGIRA
jgi:hypothetical protein